MNHLKGPVATRPPGLLILVFLCGCKYAPSSGFVSSTAGVREPSSVPHYWTPFLHHLPRRPP